MRKQEAKKRKVQVVARRRKCTRKRNSVAVVSTYVFAVVGVAVVVVRWGGGIGWFVLVAVAVIVVAVGGIVAVAVVFLL